MDLLEYVFQAYTSGRCMSVCAAMLVDAIMNHNIMNDTTSCFSNACIIYVGLGVADSQKLKCCTRGPKDLEMDLVFICIVWG